MPRARETGRGNAPNVRITSQTSAYSMRWRIQAKRDGSTGENGVSNHRLWAVGTWLWRGSGPYGSGIQLASAFLETRALCLAPAPYLAAACAHFAKVEINGCAVSGAAISPVSDVLNGT